MNSPFSSSCTIRQPAFPGLVIVADTNVISVSYILVRGIIVLYCGICCIFHEEPTEYPSARSTPKLIQARYSTCPLKIHATRLWLGARQSGIYVIGAEFDIWGVDTAAPPHDLIRYHQSQPTHRPFGHMVQYTTPCAPSSQAIFPTNHPFSIPNIKAKTALAETTIKVLPIR